jgi:hypothetical protein
MDWCVYWLVGQWVGLSIGWLVGQWIGLFIGWLVNGLVCLLVGRSMDWSVYWLVGQWRWSVYRLVGQWVDLSIGWSTVNGLSIGQLVNGLVRQLVAWSVDQSVSLLVGWSGCQSANHNQSFLTSEQGVE